MVSLKKHTYYEFGPSLRELSINISIACFVLEPKFENWVKLLGQPLTMHHFERTLRSKIG